MPPKTRSSARSNVAAEVLAHNGGKNTAIQRQPPRTTPPASKGKKKARSTASQVKPTDSRTERIVGARMSSVKHSGLLVSDEQVLKQILEEEEEEEEELVPHAQWREESEGEGSGCDLRHVSGKDIYSIQQLHRSAPRQKKKQTETRPGASATAKTPMEASKGRRRDAGVDSASPQVVEESRDDGQEERATQSSMSTRSSKRSGAVETEKGKGRAQLAFDSEENDVTSEEEDDEEMASIAAQLNKGVTAEHALEDYFTAHAGKAGVTSDRTLSRLARPRLEQETIRTALQAAPSPFRDDCQHLLENHTHLYRYWQLQMHSGFNILLYGLGTKKRLMEDFCKSCLSDACHLVVNGYFPGLTVKHILTILSSDLLGHSGTFKSYSEHAQFVTNTFEKLSGNGTVPQQVFLIVHNLDGPMLRNDRAQSALSILGVSKHIHIVASVDHINSALLWDQTKLSRLKWAWHDVTTFEAYREETSYENSLLVCHSGTLALSSLTHVMRSLTTNARGIFKLLANYQLEHKKEAERNYQGLSFAECYRRCRENFLVNSDLTLRAQLTEFRDHKLVRSAKGGDGVEYLVIPVDDATLSQFLSEFIE